MSLVSLSHHSNFLWCSTEDDVYAKFEPGKWPHDVTSARRQHLYPIFWLNFFAIRGSADHLYLFKHERSLNVSFTNEDNIALWSLMVLQQKNGLAAQKAFSLKITIIKEMSIKHR